MSGTYGFMVTDTENISGIDKEEFRAKQRREESKLKNQGVNHLLYYIGVNLLLCIRLCH